MFYIGSMLHVWRGRKPSRPCLLMAASTGVLAGLLFSRLCPVAFPLVFLLLGLPVFIVFKKPSWFGLFALVIASFVLGLWQGSQAFRDLQAYNTFFGKKVVIYAKVANDPTYDDKGRRDFYVDDVEINDQPLPGQVRVRTFQASPVSRGDSVMLSGKLYDGFGSYQANLPFAEVQLLSKNTNPVEWLRQQFFAGVYNALPEPHASLGLGFLVGLKAQLPADLQDQLRSLALTHIVVASGYNLTILIRLSRRLLHRISASQSLLGSVGLMIFMVAVTGLSASMSRAAVVTSLGLLAWWYGRVVHPGVLLALSAAATAMWDPLALWFDLGWWLSFLAFSGVLLLAPLLAARLYPGRAPPLPMQIVLEAAAAQLMAEPFIMLMFGQFSLLGLLANCFVVPTIPLAMAATAIAGGAGFFAPQFAGWFALPAQWLLGYIIQVVYWLSALPFAAMRVRLDLAGAVAVYALILALAIVLYARTGFSYRKQPVATL